VIAVADGIESIIQYDTIPLIQISASMVQCRMVPEKKTSINPCIPELCFVTYTPEEDK
jgi:hypothetical protein